MQDVYPDKLKEFYDNYHSDTNPDTKPIFALFLDKNLLRDKFIEKCKDDSNKITMLLVCVSAISVLIFLISTVFIMKVEYFS